MAVSTKRFTLNSAIYQDLSEGSANCSFRLRYQSPKDNALRIVLGTALPAAESVDFDRFDPPGINGEDVYVHYTQLSGIDRVYARADKNQLDLTVYRK